MQKILLAIDGMFPSKQMVEYAVDLCRRIRLELNILHIIDTGGCGDPLKKFQQQVQQTRERFENSMMAAAFAESGDHDTAKALMDRASANFSRLLSEEERAAIDYRVKIKAGGTDRTILDYVSHNHDIVLAIYDGSAGPETDEAPAKPETCFDEHRQIADRLQKQLSVPLVVRRGLIHQE